MFWNFVLFVGYGNSLWTLFVQFVGRTELIIGVSRAKTNEESDFEVRFLVAPLKVVKNSEKHIFKPKITPIFFASSENEMTGIV